MKSIVYTGHRLIGYQYRAGEWTAVLTAQAQPMGEPPYPVYIAIRPNGDEFHPTRTPGDLPYTRATPPPEFAAHNPFAEWLTEDED